MRAAAFLAVMVTLWATVYKLKVWPPTLFPSPLEVKTTLVDGFRDHSFQAAIWASLRRGVLGYLLSAVIGLPLGMLIARSTWVRQTIGSTVLGLQALPSICWLPLALLWFGLNERAVLFVVIMGSLFSIVTATAAGIEAINPTLISAGRTLGARGFGLYRRILLPAAMPGVITGLKLGWTFAWRSLMAGELIYSDVGLGRILNNGRDLQDMSTVVAAMFVIIAIGLLIEVALFRPLERTVQQRYGLAGAA